MNTRVSSAIILATSILFITSCNNQSTSKAEKKDSSGLQTSNPGKDNTNMENEMMTAMNSMMDRMKNMSMSGDFDIDYANMMIEHHQGAIDMSEQEIKAGTDEKIKNIAQNIISAQKEEITRLRDFVKNYKPSGMKHGEGELEKTMSGMMDGMKTLQMSDNTDRDFLYMMISHHENAVSMSRKQLEFGMSTTLKKMAQKVINDQTKEIDQFKSMLNDK